MNECSIFPEFVCKNLYKQLLCNHCKFVTKRENRSKQFKDNYIILVSFVYNEVINCEVQRFLILISLFWAEFETFLRTLTLSKNNENTKSFCQNHETLVELRIKYKLVKSGNLFTSSGFKISTRDFSFSLKRILFVHSFFKAFLNLDIRYTFKFDI